MTADLRWCESVARNLLRAMGAEECDRVTIDDVCAHYGLTTSHKVPKGCEGMIVANTVRLPVRGRPGWIIREACHEVGHIALTEWDPTLPRHDEIAADWIGRMVLIPQASAIRAARETGMDPELLRARFPGVFLEDIWTRLACATGSIAVYMRTLSDVKWVANDVTAEEALGMELRVHAAADTARSKGEYVVQGGWAAAPADDKSTGGVIVVRR